VVKGLSIVPLAAQPPVNVVRLSFQTMVGIGTLLALLGLVWLYLQFRRRAVPRWVLAAVVAAGPLSVVALITGWITTEVGRQPWIVYNVMRVSQAVTGPAASRSATARCLSSPIRPGRTASAWRAWCCARFRSLPWPRPHPARTS
jgi:cytochrome bd-type quinol oxidase subunit 1